MDLNGRFASPVCVDRLEMEMAERERRGKSERVFAVAQGIANMGFVRRAH
jgi:hypothetical protein